MTDAHRFEGRPTIVTGAASGIGRATALRFAAEGALVSCLDLADAVDETVSLITEAGGTAIAVRTDVSDPSSVDAAVAAAAEAHGPAAILANVAGVLRFAITHEASVDDFDLMLRVNLRGPFLMCRAVIPGMLEAGGGAIVNVASSAGMFGQAYNAGYCASKGGVAMMTRSIAWEYVKHSIRVNAISPGQDGLDHRLPRGHGLEADAQGDPTPGSLDGSVPARRADRLPGFRRGHADHGHRGTDRLRAHLLRARRPPILGRR